MATNKNIQNFTSFDIEKYHKGLLSPAERHAMEKAALDDPFLADALEGYSAEGVNVAADIAELKERLSEKAGKDKVVPMKKGGAGSFPWLRAAAAIVIIGGAALLTYQFVFTNKTESIAQAPANKEESATTTANDSVAIADKQDNAATGQTDEVATKEKLVSTQTVTLNGGTGKTADTIKVGDISQYKNQQTSQPVAKTADDKNAGIASTDQLKKQPAAITTKKNEEAVAATPKKDTDADGVADKIDQSKRNELARNRAATTEKKSQGLVSRYQPNIFRGRVVDNNNNGIPFANVTNVNDNVGTYTDARGYFNLTSPDSVLNVQTRALGFNNNNIELRNNITSNQVVLQEDRDIAAHVLSNRRVNTERRANDPNFKLEGEPEPEDGWDNYDSYLVNNLNIPLDFKVKQADPATVEVSFEVTRNGEPVNFKIERSLCGKCDEEAIRLIKEGPKWKRKARKGRTRVAIPFENYQ